MPDRNLMYGIARVHNRGLEFLTATDGAPFVYSDYMEALRMANGFNREPESPQEPLWEVYKISRVPISDQYRSDIVKEGIPVPND